MQPPGPGPRTCEPIQHTIKHIAAMTQRPELNRSALMHAPRLTFLAAVVGAHAATTSKPTFFIAGDSTAAADDGTPELLGWGAKIGSYLSIPVVNDAVSGSTARSFTEQGLCASRLP